jgi:hypothetical protein
VSIHITQRDHYPIEDPHLCMYVSERDRIFCTISWNVGSGYDRFNGLYFSLGIFWKILSKSLDPFRTSKEVSLISSCLFQVQKFKY